MTFFPTVIDCDTGRDDALTLWLAHRLRVPLVAVVASYGNTTLSHVVENTARVMDVVGWGNIPLLSGAAAPLHQHNLYTSLVLPRQEKAGNGLCNIELPRHRRDVEPSSSATQNAKILAALSLQKGPLDYFIIGPATNFATFLKIWGKDVTKIIGRITIMGGKFDALWTQNPTADFNIACDPFALDQVLSCGLPTRFVPLNATWPIFMPLEKVEKLEPQNQIGAFAKNLMVSHCCFFAPEPIFRFHDPSVLLAALNPHFFKNTKLSLNTNESDPNFGQLTETDQGFSSQIYQTRPDLHGFFRTSILQALGLTLQE